MNSGVRRIQKDRTQYVQFCLAHRAPGNEALRVELREIDQTIETVRRELIDAAALLTGLPGTWIARWRGQSAAVRQAEAEFDALVGSPNVAAVELVPAQRSLLVTCAYPKISPRRLRIDVATLHFSVEPALADRRRRLLNAVGPALLAAGELTGLVALAIGDAPPPSLGSRAAPRVAAGARDGYVHWRLSRLRSRGSHMDPVQLASEMPLDVFSHELASLIERAYCIEDTLATRPETDERAVETYAREYDSLCSLAGVAAITATSRAIQVCTEPITLEVDDLVYRIGRFRIEIIPGRGVMMHNQDGRRSPLGAASGGLTPQYDHPHVRAGQPCLGNMQRYLATALAASDFAVIVQQSLEFLRSFNPASRYVHPSAWPVLTDADRTVTSMSYGT